MTWKNTDLSNPIYELIESSNAYARFPHRYFVFGSADDKIMRAKAEMMDKRDDEMWAIELRRYYVKVAKQMNCELLHISVGDTATHFHSVVMSSISLTAKTLLDAWPHCDARHIKTGPHRGKRRQEVRVYDPALNGVAYCYDHHIPFEAEHIVSRRVWNGWKEDGVATAINALLKDRWTFGSSSQHP